MILILVCVSSGLSFTSKTNSKLDNELSDSPVRSSVSPGRIFQSAVRNPKSVIENSLLPKRSHESPLRNPGFLFRSGEATPSFQSSATSFRSYESTLPKPESPLQSSESPLQSSHAPYRSQEAPYPSHEALFRSHETPVRTPKPSLRSPKPPKKAPDARKVNKPASPRIHPWEDLTRRPFLEGGGWAPLRNGQDASHAQNFMSAHHARPGE